MNTSLKDKVQVEELDELRLMRIERKVVSEAAALAARPKTSSRPWGPLALGALAVAGVLLAIGLNLRSAQHGDVVQRSPALVQATELSTGPGEKSELKLGEARILVGPNSQLQVQPSSDGSTLIQLSSGSVECHVDKRPNRPVFQVQSDDVMVTVIGTVFSVERTDIVQVAVERGIVSVHDGRSERKLRAGDSWQGSPHMDVPLDALLAARADTPSETDGPVEPSNDVEHSGVDKKDPGRKNKSPKSRDKGSAHDSKGKDSIPTKVLKIPELLRDAKPIRPVFNASTGAELAALEKVSSEDPKRAVVELQTLAARSSGKTASFALYARAYLLLFELDQPARAAKAAQQYARRFPQGAEAEDMLWLRVRALCKSGDLALCRAAAHTYLRRYPKGIFRGLASKLIRAK